MARVRRPRAAVAPTPCVGAVAVFLVVSAVVSGAVRTGPNCPTAPLPEGAFSVHTRQDVSALIGAGRGCLQFDGSSCVDWWSARPVALPTFGARAFQAFSLGGDDYLAVANNYDSSTNDVNSELFRWDRASSVWVFQDNFPTLGAFDVDFYEALNGEAFLAFASERSDSSVNVDSLLYKWNSLSRTFGPVRNLPTARAWDVDFIRTLHDEEFLLTVNRDRSHSALELFNLGGDPLTWSNAEVKYPSECEPFDFGSITRIVCGTDEGAVSRVHVVPVSTTNLQPLHSLSLNAGVVGLRVVPAGSSLLVVIADRTPQLRLGNLTALMTSGTGAFWMTGAVPLQRESFRLEVFQFESSWFVVVPFPNATGITDNHIYRLSTNGALDLATQVPAPGSSSAHFFRRAGAPFLAFAQTSINGSFTVSSTVFALGDVLLRADASPEAPHHAFLGNARSSGCPIHGHPADVSSARLVRFAVASSRVVHEGTIPSHSVAARSAFCTQQVPIDAFDAGDMLGDGCQASFSISFANPLSLAGRGWRLVLASSADSSALLSLTTPTLEAPAFRIRTHDDTTELVPGLVASIGFSSDYGGHANGSHVVAVATPGGDVLTPRFLAPGEYAFDYLVPPASPVVFNVSVEDRWDMLTIPVPLPTIASIAPSFVVRRTDSFTFFVYGSAFLPDLHDVLIAGMPCTTAVARNSTCIQCTFARALYNWDAAAPSVQVRFRVNTETGPEVVERATTPHLLQVMDALHVDRVITRHPCLPVHAPSVLRIEGSQFGTNVSAIHVTLGTLPCTVIETSVEEVPIRSVNCTLLGGAGRDLGLFVSIPSGENASVPNAASFCAPTISSIDPPALEHGFVERNLTIFGANLGHPLLAHPSVTFPGQLITCARVVVISADRVDCVNVRPSGLVPRNVDLALVVGGQSVVETIQVLAAPFITGVQPQTMLPPAHPSNITLQGSFGFPGAIREVWVGQQMCRISSAGAQFITCEVPGGWGSCAPFRLVTRLGVNVTSEKCVAFVQQQITAVRPPALYEGTAAVNVTITGDNLFRLPDFPVEHVWVGGYQCGTVVYQSNNTIQCLNHRPLGTSWSHGDIIMTPKQSNVATFSVINYGIATVFQASVNEVEGGIRVVLDVGSLSSASDVETITIGPFRCGPAFDVPSEGLLRIGCIAQGHGQNHPVTMRTIYGSEALVFTYVTVSFPGPRVTGVSPATLLPDVIASIDIVGSFLGEENMATKPTVTLRQQPCEQVQFVQRDHLRCYIQLPLSVVRSWNPFQSITVSLDGRSSNPFPVVVQTFPARPFAARLSVSSDTFLPARNVAFNVTIDGLVAPNGTHLLRAVRLADIELWTLGRPLHVEDGVITVGCVVESGMGSDVAVTVVGADGAGVEAGRVSFATTELLSVSPAVADVSTTRIRVCLRNAQANPDLWARLRVGSRAVFTQRTSAQGDPRSAESCVEFLCDDVPSLLAGDESRKSITLETDGSAPISLRFDNAIRITRPILTGVDPGEVFTGDASTSIRLRGSGFGSLTPGRVEVWFEHGDSERYNCTSVSWISSEEVECTGVEWSPPGLAGWATPMLRLSAHEAMSGTDPIQLVSVAAALAPCPAPTMLWSDPLADRSLSPSVAPIDLDATSWTCATRWECPPGWQLVGRALTDCGGVLGRECWVGAAAVCVPFVRASWGGAIEAVDQCGPSVRVQWVGPSASVPFILPANVTATPEQIAGLERARLRGPWTGALAIATRAGDRTVVELGNVTEDAGRFVRETIARASGLSAGSWWVELELVDRFGSNVSANYTPPASAGSSCRFVEVTVGSEGSSEVAPADEEVRLSDLVGSETLSSRSRLLARPSPSTPSARLLFSTASATTSVGVALPAEPSEDEEVRVSCAVSPPEVASVSPASRSVRSSTWSSSAPLVFVVSARTLDGNNSVASAQPFAVNCSVASLGSSAPRYADSTAATVFGSVVNEVWPYFEDALVRSLRNASAWSSSLGRWGVDASGSLVESSAPSSSLLPFSLTLSGSLEVILVGDRREYLREGRPHFVRGTTVRVGSVSAEVLAVSRDGRFVWARTPSFSSVCGSSRLGCVGEGGSRALWVENPAIIDASEEADEVFEALGMVWENVTAPRRSRRLATTPNTPQLSSSSTQSLGMVVRCPPACPGRDGVAMTDPRAMDATRTQGLGIYYTEQCVGFATESTVCLSASRAQECAWGTADDCRPCPAGGLCPGGYRLQSQVGYWVASETATTAVQCPEPRSARCVGWSSGATQCGEGYLQGSPACSACAPGYYPSLGACAACPADAGGSRTDPWPSVRRLLIVAGAFAVFGVLMLVSTRMALKKLGRSPSEAGRLVKHMLFWTAVSMQVIASVGKTASAGLPEYLQSLYSFLGVFLLDPSFAAHPDCLQSPPFVTDMVLLSIVLVLVLAFVGLASRCPETWPQEEELSQTALSSPDALTLPVGVASPLKSPGSSASSSRQSLAESDSLVPHPVSTLSSKLRGSTSALRSVSIRHQLLTLLTLLYPITTATVINILLCRPDTVEELDVDAISRADASMTTVPLRSVSRFVLATNPYLVCYEGTHAAATLLALLVALVFVVGYPLGTWLWVHVRVRRAILWTGSSPSDGRLIKVAEIRSAMEVVSGSCCVRLKHGWWGVETSASSSGLHHPDPGASSSSTPLQSNPLASAVVQANPLKLAAPKSPVKSAPASPLASSWVQRLSPTEAHLWLRRQTDDSAAVLTDPSVRHFVNADFRASQFATRHLNFLALFLVSTLGVLFRAFPLTLELALLRFVLLLGILGSFLAYLVVSRPYTPSNLWKSAVKQYSLVLSILGAFLNWVVFCRTESGVDVFGSEGTSVFVSVGSVVVFGLSVGLLLTLFLAYWAVLLRGLDGPRSRGGVSTGPRSAAATEDVGLIELLRFRRNVGEEEVGESVGGKEENQGKAEARQIVRKTSRPSMAVGAAFSASGSKLIANTLGFTAATGARDSVHRVTAGTTTTRKKGGDG